MIVGFGLSTQPAILLEDFTEKVHKGDTQQSVEKMVMPDI